VRRRISTGSRLFIGMREKALRLIENVGDILTKLLERV
jgi:hypothetical protein